jgi:uncharacterized membrane protein
MLQGTQPALSPERLQHTNHSYFVSYLTENKEQSLQFNTREVSQTGQK